MLWCYGLVENGEEKWMQKPIPLYGLMLCDQLCAYISFGLVLPCCALLCLARPRKETFHILVCL